MKKIIFLLGALLPLCVFAQPGGFSITGTLEHYTVAGGYVYLVYPENGRYRIDSSKVRSGVYSFKGTVPAMTAATLLDVSPSTSAVGDMDHVVAILLENAAFSVRHVDAFAAVRFSGTLANADYSRVRQEIAPILVRQRALSAAYQKAAAARDTAAVRHLEQQFRDTKDEISAGVFMRFVRDNPGSPIALYLLKSAFSERLDPDSVEAVFMRLPAAIRSSPEGVALRGRIDVVRNTGVGRVAPSFTQTDTAGKEVSLSSFRGGYVLIDFWASWCGPCRKENPNVVAAYERYKDRGFRVIGVSLDKAGDREKWLAAIRKDGLVWTQVSDLRYWDNAVAKAYGISSIPQNFLLDPQGRIVAKGLRGEGLMGKLEEIYK